MFHFVLRHGCDIMKGRPGHKGLVDLNSKTYYIGVSNHKDISGIGFKIL